MCAVHSDMLDVDGARLYYETRGDGPPVLLVPGAGGDAGYFSGLADDLADAFTVVTYDRRGNSRSTGRVDAPMSVAEQAADARALVEGPAGGRALVFGNSGGAIVALDLAARHPDVVRGVVAHEPPVVGVLPADDPWSGFFGRIAETYRAEGPQAAGVAFTGTIRGEGTYAWPEDVVARFVGNVDHLFRWEWDAWSRFLPDEAALSARTFPLVLGAGSEDRGLYYARPAVEIARRVGAAWAEFPGIHLEFLRRPQVFGAALRAVLTQMHSSVDAVPSRWTAEVGDAPPA